MDKNAKRARNTVFPIAMSLAMVIGILPMSMTANEDSSVVEKSTFGTMATPTDSLNEEPATPGDTDDGVDSNEDGIDDKYQKDVTLTAKNGTFSDGTTSKTIKVTLYDDEGNLSETGFGNILANQIPVTGEEYADEFYTVEDRRESFYQEIIETAKWKNAKEEIDDLSTYMIQSDKDYSFVFEYIKDTDLYTWGTEHIILDVDGKQIQGSGEEVVSGYYWKKLGSPQYYTLAEFDLQKWPTGYTTFEPRGEILWGGWDYSKFKFLGAELNGEPFDYNNVHVGMKLASGMINYYYQVRSGMLTINYVDEEGKALDESYSKKIGLPNQFNKQDWNEYYNGKYSVKSPNIDGYELVDESQATIEGVMTDENGLTVNVEYKKVEEDDPYIPPVDPRPDRPDPEEPEEEIEEEETPETGGEEEIEEELTPEVGKEEEEVIEEEETPEVGNKDEVTDTGVASTLPWLFGLMTSAIVAVAELFRRKQR